jgi:hypothetical protein
MLRASNLYISAVWLINKNLMAENDECSWDVCAHYLWYMFKDIVFIIIMALKMI